MRLRKSMRLTSAATAIAIIVFAISVLMLFTSFRNTLFYCLSSYHGDGVIDDKGFWSYPRYYVCFESFPDESSRFHEYHIANLPQVPLSFSLEIKGEVPDERLQEFAQGFYVGVTITDKDGHTCASYSNLLDNWVLCWSLVERYYWHPSLTDLEVWKYGDSLLKIETQRLGYNKETVTLEPRLSGGGNELP